MLIILISGGFGTFKKFKEFWFCSRLFRPWMAWDSLRLWQSLLESHLGLTSALYVNGEVIHTKAIIFCVDFSLENTVFQSTALYLWAGWGLSRRGRQCWDSCGDSSCGRWRWDPPPRCLCSRAGFQPIKRTGPAGTLETSIKPVR